MSRTADGLIPLERLERAASALRVLAHPHRLRICELVMRDRVSVNDIAEHLGIPASAASQHLGILKAYGLLAPEREGKTVFYRVVDSRPAWILTCIREHAEPLPDGRGSDRASRTRSEDATGTSV